MLVRVCGSNDAGWYGGMHEGKEGVVMNVDETEAGLTQTAAVNFKVDGVDQELVVPLRCLQPVPPASVGDSVVGLDGKHKGVKMEVRSHEPASNSWIVSSDGGAFEEVPEDRLVRLVPDDY
jgi:hypothetical protein